MAQPLMPSRWSRCRKSGPVFRANKKGCPWWAAFFASATGETALYRAPRDDPRGRSRSPGLDDLFFDLGFLAEADDHVRAAARVGFEAHDIVRLGVFQQFGKSPVAVE